MTIWDQFSKVSVFHFINISYQSQSEARSLIPRHAASQMKNTAGLLGQEIISLHSCLDEDALVVLSVPLTRVLILFNRRDEEKALRAEVTRFCLDSIIRLYGATVCSCVCVGGAELVLEWLLSTNHHAQTGATQLHSSLT